jgi:putative aldouronate transport system substrate-binding protein
MGGKIMKKKLLALLLTLALVLTVFTGCVKKRVPGDDFVYPDTGFADDKSDSWLQIEAGDTRPLTINWFVNLSYFGTAATDGTLVEKKIYEKTGVKINFITPIVDDGVQLSTMISGNKLPDVVTVSGGSDERVQLAEEGYIYPLQELSKRYAPSLMTRVDPEVLNFFKASDGNSYGLPNHFYTKADMDAFSAQEGTNLLPNGNMVARKDYLDAYLAANPNATPTTPEGFIQMCLWVKNHYALSNSNPTVLLNPFTVTGSTAEMWIREYFCVPKEDANGNLVDETSTPQYKEAMLFLNRLYRENLISSANFTTNAGTFQSYIANGMPFVMLGSPQEWTAGFIQAKLAEDIDYVPIIITNSAGDVPQLRSLAGAGWLTSMITANCKRPDRVIKLFDYLWSEEGQSLFFGVEGETFDYEIRPGATVGGKTYKYGRIAWKPEVWEEIRTGAVAKYGFMYFNPLVNPMFPRMASPAGEVLNGYADYVAYNIKAALMDYTYTANGFDFSLDVLSPDYNEMMDISANLSNIWVQYIPRIINAKSAAESEQILSTVLSQTKAMGSDRLLAFRNVSFKASKVNMGISFVWPPADPSSGYKDLKVTSLFGDPSQVKEIPEDLLPENNQ